MFQKTMDEILQGIPRTICYIHDILVTGSSDAEHLEILNKVLQRLQDHGVRVKQNKCIFFSKSMEYLGHSLDAESKHAMSDKYDAIQNAPTPKNMQELRSFLGLLNYYRKFLPNIASILHPLNELLRANKLWEWTSEQAQAFQKAKNVNYLQSTSPLQSRSTY